MNMALCKLPDGQKAALMFLQAIKSAPADGKYVRIKEWVRERRWHDLAFVASMMTSSPGAATPTEEDLAAVGSLPEGVQNAHYYLALVDVQHSATSKLTLLGALSSHCYDRVAHALVKGLSSSGLTFTGHDLHIAFAPDDQQPCEDHEDPFEALDPSSW